jgi:uncharacterized protein HemX
MKNVLMGTAAIALLIAAGSVAYYFVLFLPQQQSRSERDISAIRAVVAPTPQELAQQQAAAQKDMAQRQAKLDSYLKCITDTTQNGSAYISTQCPDAMTSMLEHWKCADKVRETAYFKEHFTCK